GAYLTKVEEGEERLLAQTSARALEDASRPLEGQAGPSGQEGRKGQEQREGQQGQEGRVGPVGETEGDHASEAGELTRAEPDDAFRAVEGRWGSREVEIIDVAFLDGGGKASFIFHTGDTVSVRMRVRAHQAVDDFVFGVGLFNADGVCCYGTNTYLEEL